MPTPRKRDVIISIQGCRFSPNPSDNHLVDVVTNGSMVKHPQGYTVSYREPFDRDEGAQTTLLVEGGRVTMLRSGSKNSQMVFEEGRRHVSYYDAEDGPVTVGVTASRVAAEIGKEGGRIEVDYGIEIAGNLAEESYVSIDIRAATGPWLTVPDGISVYRDTFIN
ncbi:MAG: DUF1934 domain-containing protein [Oscillospiraceae bacterium]|jgi:uncharacterized beta-barrel protein YwiB (DUF1934 family)|nr:DUF1934 domain-containing protein [Oscillospiraceae bacterium]